MAKRTRAEKKASKPQLSTEAQAQVQTIANTVTPVSFTKQQRKEVQQAIESGMATVRAQANSKSREREKQLKKLQKQLATDEGNIVTATEASHGKSNLSAILPWGFTIADLDRAGYLFGDVCLGARNRKRSLGG